MDYEQELICRCLKPKHLNSIVTIMLHMSQISYSIFSALMKKNIHLRGLAKELKTNQMTISRKIKKLEEENILDYRKEGKNNVYFIKKSLEAEEYKKVIEHTKLIKLISEKPRTRKIVFLIKEHKKIKLAIIFGSYARGTETEESDIDLYVETKDNKIKKELELIDSKLSIKIGGFDKNNLLVKEIIKNHVIIKGVDKYYEHIHKTTN